MPSAINIKSLALSVLAKLNAETAPSEKCPTVISGLGHSNPAPQEPSSSFWGPHRDQYGWRANVTIEFIAASPDYPAGMIAWLATAAPTLYDQLTGSIPDRISRAWDARVPFDQFDLVCHELENTHKRALAFYRQEEQPEWVNR